VYKKNAGAIDRRQRHAAGSGAGDTGQQVDSHGLRDQGVPLIAMRAVEMVLKPVREGMTLPIGIAAIVE